jgi:hypothetical protein
MDTIGFWELFRQSFGRNRKRGLCGTPLLIAAAEAKKEAEKELQNQKPNQEMYWIPMDAPEGFQIALSVKGGPRPSDESDHASRLKSDLVQMGIDYAEEFGAEELREMLYMFITDYDLAYVYSNVDDKRENVEIFLQNMIYHSDLFVIRGLEDFKTWRQDKHLQDSCREFTIEDRLSMLTDDING